MESLEHLEPRRLLAAVLQDNLLYVNGTAGDDRITVFLEPGDQSILTVAINSRRTSFSLADVLVIYADGRGGDDAIRFDASAGMGLTAFTNGGGGNDTIFGSLGRNEIAGDEGDDVIVGHSKADVLRGGAGNDTIFGNRGNDEIEGGH